MAEVISDSVPMDLAEDHVDNVPVGLAWLAFMFYIMLFCQHRICEAYFVPALNVLMDSMGNKENLWLKRLGNPGVAGATFMALGANGPELFTNLFSLFSHSDGGIGVVIGSEIFNLLVIIGASVVCTANDPLMLEKVPFARDVLYYALSIALLLWALYQNNPFKKTDQIGADGQPVFRAVAGDEKGTDGLILKWEAGVMLLAAVSYWVMVYFTADIASAVFGIKEDDNKAGYAAKIRGHEVDVMNVYNSRMADGHAQSSQHVKLDVTERGIMTDMGEPSAGKRQSVGFNVGGQGLMEAGGMLKYSELAEVTVSGAAAGEGVIILKFHRSFAEEVTLKVKTKDGKQREDILNDLKEHAHDDHKGNATWIHNYDPTCANSFAHLKHGLGHGGCMDKLHAIGEFFIDFVLSSTLYWCDVKDVTKEGRWIPCFMGAMFWLAFFSWLMVQVMGEISSNIAFLSPMLLGVTIGAIGTSLPNAMGSIIMAKQGKSAAAIGNAFGSNVQNVFLAMAGPWMIYMCATGEQFVPNSLDAKGQTVGEGVNWMLGTLVLVLFFAVIPQSCTLTKAYGYMFLVIYAGYLGWTIYEFVEAGMS